MGKMMLLGVGGIVAIIAAFKIVGALFGTVLALAAFLLFRILPLIIIGWLLMKVWRYLTTRPAA